MNTITSKLKQFAFGLALMAVVLPHFALADSQGATYRVTFTATWSNKTHPHADFPAHAFFSPLIGGVHSDRAVYWKVGGLASPGIKLMAEEGIPDGLASDVKADIDHGLALAVLSTPMTTDSPGSNTIAAFQVTKDFPLVTLVAMFAPTPDWFTGVSGLSLLDDHGNWVTSKVVMLYPFDAGTQQNLRYALHQPPEPKRRPIYSLSGSEWFTTEPVGNFNFSRVK
jgi:hypothetical protein